MTWFISFLRFRGKWQTSRDEDKVEKEIIFGISDTYLSQLSQVRTVPRLRSLPLDGGWGLAALVVWDEM